MTIAGAAARAAAAILLAAFLCWLPAAAQTEHRWQPRDIAYPGTIRLHVDARDVDRGIFRVKAHMPVARPGDLRLIFPRWVPGNHGPTAPLPQLAGLVVRGGGTTLKWRRDPVEMNAFTVVVPPSVRALDLDYAFVSAPAKDYGRVVATPEMLNLQWFSLLLYPAGHFARRIEVEPEVTLPAGWSFATQLHALGRDGDTVRFGKVSLEALLDSPIFAGRYHRSFELGKIGPAPVFMQVFADRPESLAASDEALDAHRRLVEQVGKLFGPAPFQRYDFLFALSRELGGIGTEHLSSSENSSVPEYFTDWPSMHAYRFLLPHEIVHSWNGKARRPADLWTPDFSRPSRNSLLWVYEGQTSLYGWVLAARSGLMTPDQVLGRIAIIAANQAYRPGSAWRSMLDAGNEAILNSGLSQVWPSWQLNMGDLYEQAFITWLEVDWKLRALSGERASLDDFARRFFAGGGERASLYTFDDVAAALGAIVPFDWRSFLRVRIDGNGFAQSADWLSGSGYHLTYSGVPTEHYAAAERRVRQVQHLYSIGLSAASETGRIVEVVWNSPAFEVGLVPGGTIRMVGGKPFEPGLLGSAITANRGGGKPIRLTVADRGRERTVSIDYRGGLRYPRLVRDAAGPDRLGDMLRAK